MSSTWWLVGLLFLFILLVAFKIRRVEKERQEWLDSLDEQAPRFYQQRREDERLK